MGGLFAGQGGCGATRRGPGRPLDDQRRDPGPYGCHRVFAGGCVEYVSKIPAGGSAGAGASGRSPAASSRRFRSGGCPSTHRAYVARSTATLFPAHSATWAGGTPSLSHSSSACAGCRHSPPGRRVEDVRRQHGLARTAPRPAVTEPARTPPTSPWKGRSPGLSCSSAMHRRRMRVRAGYPGTCVSRPPRGPSGRGARVSHPCRSTVFRSPASPRGSGARTTGPRRQVPAACRPPPAWPRLPRAAVARSSTARRRRRGAACHRAAGAALGLHVIGYRAAMAVDNIEEDFAFWSPGAPGPFTEWLR